MVASLMTLAYKASPVEEIPESIRDRVIHQMDTRSLLQMPMTGEIMTELKTRKRFYYFHQGSPKGDNHSFFTPDVSNTTIIEANSAEEANAKAVRFGIRFRTSGMEGMEYGSDEWWNDDSDRWYRATEDIVIDGFSLVYQSNESIFIHFMDGTMIRRGKCKTAGSQDYFDFWEGFNHDFTKLPEISGLSLIDKEKYNVIAKSRYTGKIPPQYITTN